MNGLEHALWYWLKCYCRGHENAQTIKTLSFILSLQPRTIQELVHSLTVNHGKPIAASCSKPKGLFVAVTQEEKDRYVTTLDARLREIYLRRRAFSKVPLAELVDQGAFEFGE